MIRLVLALAAFLAVSEIDYQDTILVAQTEASR